MICLDNLRKTSITIYNKRYNKELRLDEWNRTVIDNCSWYGKQEVTVTNEGLNTADNYTVRVTEKFDNFVKPSEYKGIGWTVANGDIVVKGKLEKDILSEKEITSKYDDCFIITGNSDNRRGSLFLQHIKIKGK